MDKIRWGIIGPGIIANEFAHDFQFVASGELAAVASRSLDRAENFAGKYGIPRKYSSYEDLYLDPAIDAIYVATPHNFHLEQSSEALKAGKAVLCEKPITISSHEFQRLEKDAGESGNYLVEGMWSYFLPAIQKAKEWVDEGRLGTIRHVKSDFGYPVPFDPTGRMYNPELAGGALLDMGVYTVAMAWLFNQKDPNQVTVIAHHTENGVNDDVTALFEYDDAVANLTTSFRSKLNNYTYVIGEKGYIAIPDFWRAKECFLYELEEVVDHYQDPRSGFGFEYEIEAVSQEILSGASQSQIVSHETSAKIQQHMELIMEKF